jgi:D-tyrosyl-tRNA(Tyr) deacylase
MRAVIQRVSQASVTIDGQEKAAINNGLLILLGVCEEDNEEDIDWLVKKIINLRIFDDDEGVMNRSVIDIDGEIMVISQFTLFASYKKGNRPSWFKAAKPPIATPLYQLFCQKMEAATNKTPATGIFGADMKVKLINDGPVTICMDTKNKE